jgi:ATP-dependent Clp protease ATP-binding subunit ClpB
MEKHNVSRLVGAPPGYIGYEEGGQLTEAVRRNPYSVVLLDEVEKAHPDVFNLLLQILDDGRLTDSQGRVVDFKNTILIMTSNIGSSHLLEEDGTGEISEKAKEQVMRDLKAHFRPEFLNRVDDTVLFTPLSLNEIEVIVGKLLGELENRLAERQIKISLSDEAKRYIAKEGFDPIYGARPLKRFIQRNIETLVAKKIISGEISDGSAIRINMENGDFKISL